MPLARTPKDYFNIAIGSALGLGLSPIAPGTCGALLGVLIHVLIALFLPANWQIAVLVFVLLVVCWGNYALTPWAEKYWQSKDPKHFVLDEVAGYLLVPILFRQGRLWQITLWGFVLFRIFDIIKLPPARQIDRNWTGPWGIVLDDLVSAVYAVVMMFLLLKISKLLGWEAWLLANVGTVEMLN